MVAVNSRKKVRNSPSSMSMAEDLTSTLVFSSSSEELKRGKISWLIIFIGKIYFNKFQD
jgi:hypothetical protein